MAKNSKREQFGNRFKVYRQDKLIVVPGLNSYTLTDEQAADLCAHIMRQLPESTHDDIMHAVDGNFPDDNTDYGTTGRDIGNPVA